jgi:hypothetical protein
VVVEELHGIVGGWKLVGKCPIGPTTEPPKPMGGGIEPIGPVFPGMKGAVGGPDCRVFPIRNEVGRSHAGNLMSCDVL